MSDETSASFEIGPLALALHALKPCAKWTDDCQGKKDYDGRLLSISTRYWPGSYRSDRHPSASTAIVLNWGDPDEYGYGETTTWREAEFVADTEAEVKMLVEAWVRSQMYDVMGRIGIRS